MPLIALGIVGIVAIGWAADQAGDAAEQAGQPVKWIVAGGVVYVAYKALKSGGAIK